MASGSEIEYIKKEQDRLAQDQAETKSLIVQQIELSKEQVTESKKTNEALGKVLLQLTSNNKTVEFIGKELDEVKRESRVNREGIVALQKENVALNGMADDWRLIKSRVIWIVVTGVAVGAGVGFL